MSPLEKKKKRILAVGVGLFAQWLTALKLCRAHVTVSINRKKPQVDLRPKIQPLTV